VLQLLGGETQRQSQIEVELQAYQKGIY